MVLIPFPETLLDESINQDLVCAHVHSISLYTNSKDPDVHVLDG